MKDLSIKKIVLCALALFIAVFILSGPAFNLIQIKVLNSFGVSGYDLFDYTNALSVNETFCLIVTIFMMIYGIITVILSIVALLRFSSEKTKGTCLATVIGGLIL